MSGPAGGALRGLGVLVTRPSERAAGLVERIAAAGGRPLALPVIELEAAVPEAPPRADAYDLAVFISPAAVAHGVTALGITPGTAPPLAAVGPTTGRALAQAGFRVAVGPGEPASSEGLLACPELARERIAGRRVLIVRGQGGREQMARELAARGAAVDYVEVYRRVRPSRYDPDLIAASDIVSVTSGEGLDNLLAMVTRPERQRLRRLPLAVAAERIGALARARGFAAAIASARQPGDEGLIEAILRCAEGLDAPS